MSFQKSKTKNLVKDEAVKAFAIAYHTFATKNKGLYRLIMSIPSEDDDLGYFYYYSHVDLEKSRAIAVECFLKGLHAELDSSNI